MKISKTVLLLSFLFSINAYAVEVNFSGKLIESVPCIINNNDPIDVDFGDDLIVSMIPIKGGTTYLKDINFTWECKGLASGTNIKFNFGGTGADFDTELLVINEQDDIAIQLFNGATPVLINEDFSYSYQSDGITPPLKASLIKSDASDVVIYPGVFTANSILTVAYQ